MLSGGYWFRPCWINGSWINGSWINGSLINGKRRINCDLQGECIERLDQPGIGGGTLGEVDIGLTVEQHQNSHVGGLACAVIEAQRHRRRHATHRPNLQVENHEIRCALGNDRRDIASLVAHGERCVGSAECRDDVVDYVFGIGGDEDVHEATLPATRPLSIVND